MAGEQVCAIGIWHLGCVVSASLADLGYSVTGVDSDAANVEKLNAGVPPLFEPGLEALVRSGIDSGRLRYTADRRRALRGAQYILITLDTPVDDEDEVDLSEIYAMVPDLAAYAMDDCLILVTSQVPVGTCDDLRLKISQRNASLRFSIAYSPENLRLGTAIEAFRAPDRIVIGADDEPTLDRLSSFLDVIDAPKVRMSLRSAEMTKHAINAFLATSISFANQIALLCDAVGADALMVTQGLRTERRIGERLPLSPGLGFAGGTLARDLKVLKNLGSQHACDTPLIDSVLKVNDSQNKIVAVKLEKMLGSLTGLKVGILGLTYKAGTSTLRRSVALEIVKELVEKGVTVRAYDPRAAIDADEAAGVFELCTDPYVVAEGSDALVVLTGWQEFRDLDYGRVRSVMKQPVIVDAANTLNDEQLRREGFLYSGVGKGQTLQGAAIDTGE